MNPLIAGVAGFGVLGVLARWGVQTLMGPMSGAFPWGTFSVNIAGAFAAGLTAGLATGNLKTSMLVGFFGGFTTYSAFFIESLVLYRAGHVAVAITYWIATPFLGTLACLLGLKASGG